MSYLSYFGNDQMFIGDYCSYRAKYVCIPKFYDGFFRRRHRALMF